MLTLGITGGVATGKSAVTRRFAARGAITFSADEAARAVLTPGSSLLSALAADFGADILMPSGLLDRARLAQRVFTDEAARKRLETLLHPAILRLLRAQMDACRYDFSHGVVAVEVPLLFETHLQPWFDLTLVVAASEEKQIARLQARNGLSESEAHDRLAAQGSLQAKIALADLVLYNDGSLAQLQQDVDVTWSRLPLERTHHPGVET